MVFICNFKKNCFFGSWDVFFCWQFSDQISPLFALLRLRTGAGHSFFRIRCYWWWWCVLVLDSEHLFILHFCADDDLKWRETFGQLWGLICFPRVLLCRFWDEFMESFRWILVGVCRFLGFFCDKTLYAFIGSNFVVFSIVSVCFFLPRNL